MTYPISIHEQSDGGIFKSPFNFRNLLAEILEGECYTLDIKCSQEMLDEEEFEVLIELENLGMTIQETLVERKTGFFDWSYGEIYETISNAATFWRWAAICGKKSLTTSNS